jgi:hypothetical protein
MEKRHFLSRVAFPVLIVAGIAFASGLIYFASGGMERSMLHTVTASLSGLAYFLAISFGPLYVFAATRLRGSSIPEAVLASSVTPFLWMTKEVLVLTGSHPFLECLYWYLNPLNIWLAILMVAEFGAAALIVRSKKKKRTGVAVGSVLAPVALIAGSLTVFALMYAWGKGENLYVIFLEGYRVLFGSGL